MSALGLAVLIGGITLAVLVPDRRCFSEIGAYCGPGCPPTLCSGVGIAPRILIAISALSLAAIPVRIAFVPRRHLMGLIVIAVLALLATDLAFIAQGSTRGGSGTPGSVVAAYILVVGVAVGLAGTFLVLARRR
jgi:hypothetical protein